MGSTYQSTSQLGSFDLAYYYFIAHTKEMGEDEKRAATALFTDLDPADLADGAFDEKLFHEAYTVVGEKRFDLFYKAARYIGNSNYHSRARRFADTALGKIDEETITEQIHSKRNKDAVCSLGTDSRQERQGFATTLSAYTSLSERV